MTRDPMFTSERLQRLHEMEPLHFWFAARRVIVDRLLATETASGPKDVLDIGCGTGWLVERLAAAGHRLTAVDYRPDAIAAVRERCAGARAIVADAASIPLPDGSADVIVLLDVLEHTDDSAAFAEVHRLLRPGGLALIGVPAFPRLWSFRDEDAGHRRRYTRSTLRRVLKARGLTPTGLRYFQFLLFPVIVVEPLDRTALGSHPGCRGPAASGPQLAPGARQRRRCEGRDAGPLAFRLEPRCRLQARRMPGPFELVLFSVDPELIRSAVGAGVSTVIVDWEFRGKREGQRSADTEINRHTTSDLHRVRSASAGRAICRIDTDTGTFW